MKIGSKLYIKDDINIFFVNNIIKNTYCLLSFTILFSALVSCLTLFYNLKFSGVLFNFFVSIFLYFLIYKFRFSVYGILFVFLFTGFFGYCTGCIISSILLKSNNYYVVTMALSTTGLLFLLLSAYTLFSRKNFNFLNGFIFISFILLIFIIVVNIFFSFSILHLIITYFIIVFSSAVILYETSEMIYNGETNYILVTISLYCAIYNIFISFLGVFNSD